MARHKKPAPSKPAPTSRNSRKSGAKKKAPAAPASKAPRKPTRAKTVAAKAPPAKPAPAPKPSPKAAPVAAAPAPAPVPPKAPAAPIAPKSAAAPVPPKPSAKSLEKGKAREALRSRILGHKKSAKPIAFSLEEVREIAKAIAAKTPENGDKATRANQNQKVTRLDAASHLAKPAQPNHVKAASLADILGFNPHKPTRPAEDHANIPEKFRRYFKLLIDLRNHVTGQLDLHTEDTLKRSAKDDAGDLSSYGQHMADAGTDTFDRDFALSLVSSEQEALSEIEAAIQRIKTGSYGICEMTQKPIAKERLLAVPFTRFSAEAQKEIERNRYRSRTGAGLFGELGEEGGSLGGGDSGDDE